MTAAITSASPGDRINLTLGCTYTLTTVQNTDGAFGANGLPLINKTLTIEGNGATITRSGSPFRFFDIGAGGNLTVDRLTMRNASVPTNGGAILIKTGGALTVSRSTVATNSAGAAGGGIYNAGAATISSSTFVDNSADIGGAVTTALGATLTVTNSTFAANTATTFGGAIKNFGTATVGSSTLSGNTSPAGDGAISSTGTFALQNSIVANNPVSNCSPVGPVTDGGHNISWPDTSCPGLNADPQLMPLTGNGGPNQTFALPASSPAIDAVPAVGAGCLPTDQREVSRPQGPNCDIGAFELAAIPAPTPTPAGVPSPPSTGHRPADNAGWFRAANLAVTLGGLMLLGVAVQVWRRRSISVGGRIDN